MVFLGMEWALEEDLLYRPKGWSASWSGEWAVDVYELTHGYSVALVVNNGLKLSLQCEGETKEIALSRLEKAVERAKELFGEL